MAPQTAHWVTLVRARAAGERPATSRSTSSQIALRTSKGVGSTTSFPPLITGGVEPSHGRIAAASVGV
ncbi:hypothetical protein, partial [Sphingomonas sp.]|uniref:hypothetical protein n=1 Tax=Sphingomonas sp. TaxID=28214 RepID=UPI003B3A5D39